MKMFRGHVLNKEELKVNCDSCYSHNMTYVGTAECSDDTGSISIYRCENCGIINADGYGKTILDSMAYELKIKPGTFKLIPYKEYNSPNISDNDNYKLTELHNYIFTDLRDDFEKMCTDVDTTRMTIQMVENSLNTIGARIEEILIDPLFNLKQKIKNFTLE